MRYLAVAALFTALAALAGCESAPTKSAPAVPAYTPPTAKQLKGVAAEFHDKDANATVADGQLPLKFLDLEGKAVNLSDYRGKSNVVLVVVKGLPLKTTGQHQGQFCPGCLAQVGELAANYEKFKAKQTEVVVVFPGATEKVPDFLAQSHATDANNPKLPFPLLYDTDLKAVDALGIRGDRARPSTYILDKQGNAVFAYVGSADPQVNTTDRPSVSSLLARLDKLNGKQ